MSNSCVGDAWDAERNFRTRSTSHLTISMFQLQPISKDLVNSDHAITDLNPPTTQSHKFKNQTDPVGSKSIIFRDTSGIISGFSSCSVMTELQPPTSWWYLRLWTYIISYNFEAIHCHPSLYLGTTVAFTVTVSASTNHSPVRLPNRGSLHLSNHQLPAKSWFFKQHLRSQQEKRTRLEELIPGAAWQDLLPGWRNGPILGLAINIHV